MCTCKIQWPFRTGDAPAPCSNPAIGEARRDAYTKTYGWNTVRYAASEWFPICAEHKAMMAGPGMEVWSYREGTAS